MVSTGGQTYLYDGDGKRVEKASGSPLVANKLDWYGTDSNPVIETDANGNEFFRYFYFDGQLVTREEASDWVDHYGLDALGNVRWVYGTNSGSPYTVNWDVSDHYPFGTERVLQSNSTNNRKFTSKERDSESGNDNFGARYYSSAMGRWMSPDRLNLTDDRLVNPSNTLNKYIYGANNPLSYIDPDGRDLVALYEPPNLLLGSEGHFMLFANDPSTGESAMMSFGELDNSLSGRLLTMTGGPMTATQTFGWPTSADNLRDNYAALSIQTTPDQAQEVINWIKNFSPSSNDYRLFSKNCATVCRDALKALGLIPQNNRNITPKGFWKTLFKRYSANTNSNRFWKSVGIIPGSKGTDYGNPRFGMDTFNFIMLQLKPNCTDWFDWKTNTLHGCPGT